MKTHRIYYFSLSLIVVFLGIISRKIDCIPLWTGDFLYAVLIYILTKIVWINKKSIQVAGISLLICYCVEFFQLYQADWIIPIRKTLFGKYVLGQGFLWTDLLAYTFGILTSFIIEKIIFKNYTYGTSFRLKQQK